MVYNIREKCIVVYIENTFRIGYHASWKNRDNSMMYDIVHFTGLSLKGDELFTSRFHEGVIPAHWTRISMVENLSIAANKRWIEENLTGRYAIYKAFGRTNLFFEDKSSAVLYKLLDGDKASIEEKIIQIIP
jgi:hypothetical protein